MAALICHSQEDPVFTIISLKGTVLLDGDTVLSGQSVNLDSKELVIKKRRSYACLLTANGYAFKLGRGKYLVKGLSKRKLSNLIEIKRNLMGPVHTSIKDYKIEIMKTPAYEYSELAGDSLTIIWRTNEPIEPDYTIQIVNLFEDPIYDSSVTSNTITVGVSKWFEREPALLFEVRGKTYGSRQIIVRIPEKKLKESFQYDLKCIAANEFVNRTLQTLALCEIHNLYFDQLYYLHKLWAYTQKTGIPVKHKYYQRILVEYDFESYFSPMPKSN